MKNVESDALLTKITNPFKYSEVVHGTYFEPLPLILKGGLNRMARNHVHFALGYPGNEGLISGMRGSCEVVIELNLTKAMHGEHKIPFYESSNKVILSEGLKDGSIPPQYFRAVYDFKKNQYIEMTSFDYICVFDFECTCEDNDTYPKTLNMQEIIEFPIVIIDVKQRAIKSVFQTYVKPTVDPKLTDFCTQLTGITQEQVDAGVSIQDALKQAHRFLG